MICLGIEKMVINFRKTVTVEKRLPMALCLSSTGSVYRTISKVFGIAKSAVIKIVKELNWFAHHLNLSNSL